jgi:hypothetical protein
VITVIEEDIPTPKAGEVRVKVLAGGSLPDVLAREGVHPETPRVPYKPGWDLVGSIDQLGEGPLLPEETSSDPLRPVGIMQNVTNELDGFVLAGLELIAGERLGHIGRVPRMDRDWETDILCGNFPGPWTLLATSDAGCCTASRRKRSYEGIGMRCSAANCSAWRRQCRRSAGAINNPLPIS